MPTLLNDFSAEYRDRLLEILWRQWTALGVSGHGRPWQGSVLDPEALLLFSSTIARHDARLFDAVLEWIQTNGRFVNVQRIKRMLKDEVFRGEVVFQAMASRAGTSIYQAKWARLTSGANKRRTRTEPLFYLKDGRPLRVVRKADELFEKYGLLRDRFEERGVAERFRPEPLSNLLLRLRALLGVNARCEILLFLALRERGSPRAMARDCYYFPATLSKALAEMAQSGYVISRTEGRHRYYRLKPDAWRGLLPGDSRRPAWVTWARLFSAFEQVWLFLSAGELAGKTVLEQASSLRRVLRGSVASQLDRSGLPFMFGDDSAHPGEALVPFFVERMRDILKTLEDLEHEK